MCLGSTDKVMLWNPRRSSFLSTGIKFFLYIARDIGLQWSINYIYNILYMLYLYRAGVDRAYMHACMRTYDPITVRYGIVYAKHCERQIFAYRIFLIESGGTFSSHPYFN